MPISYFIHKTFCPCSNAAFLSILGISHVLMMAGGTSILRFAYIQGAGLHAYFNRATPLRGARLANITAEVYEHSSRLVTALLIQNFVSLGAGNDREFFRLIVNLYCEIIDIKWTVFAKKPLKTLGSS